VAQEVTVNENDTLLSLLSDLENVDNGLLNFNPEEHRELLLKAELKIDAYKYMDVKYDSRIREVADEIKALTEIKRSLESKQTALRKTMIWVFKEKSIDKFSGVKYVASLISKTKISIFRTEPDAPLYFKFPHLIKREYSWDKRAFDNEFKSNPELQNFATEEKSEYITFKLKKGLDQ